DAGNKNWTGTAEQPGEGRDSSGGRDASKTAQEIVDDMERAAGMNVIPFNRPTYGWRDRLMRRPARWAGRRADSGRLQSRSKGARGRCHPRRTSDSADAPEVLGNLLRLSVSWRFCPNNCPAKARPVQAVVRYAYVSEVSLVGVA